MVSTGLSEVMGSWKIMLIFAAADGAHLRAVGRVLQEVVAFEPHLSPDDPAGAADELHDGELGDRLAAAALAHHAHDLPLVDRVGDPVHRVHDALPRS